MKYVFIDTCVFVGCCLLENEGDTNINGALETLLTKLEAGELTLLLPEVVQLELPKVLATRLEEMKGLTKIVKDSAKEAKIKGQALKPKMLSDLHSKIEDFANERATNVEATKTIVDKIFAHSNTKKIAITPDIMVEAVKYKLGGKKPTKTDSPIQGDNIIVASLAEALKGETGYQFFLCTSNPNDFADSSDTSGANIHPDIAAHFSNIKYYANLLELMNAEFQTSYPTELIEKLAEESIPPKKPESSVLSADVLGATGAAEAVTEPISGPESSQ